MRKVRNIIGKIIFWFIKDQIEIWNGDKAIQRMNFYKGQTKHLIEETISELNNAIDEAMLQREIIKESHQ